MKRKEQKEKAWTEGKGRRKESVMGEKKERKCFFSKGSKFEVTPLADKTV